MKKRNGFVSNSSSSSFMIGMKGKLTEKKMMEVLCVPEKSPLHKFAKDVSKWFVDGAQKFSKEEFLEEYWCEDEEDIPESAKKIFDSGMSYYRCSASSEEYGIEACMYDLEINYEDKDFVLIKEDH